MLSAARILVVDDDDDTREVLSVALTGAGYAVDHASNADEGLLKLKAGQYDLVLSDYDMPGRTGTAMLHEAEALGLLGSTPVLMISAHTHPPVDEGMEVINKPIDLDRFLPQLRKLVAPRAAPPLLAAQPDASKVDLVLYVAERSAASVLARQNLERVLQQFRPEAVTLEVRDLARFVEQAEQDRVVFIPTLVKRSPAPRTWVLGDLSDGSAVADLLVCSGLERRG